MGGVEYVGEIVAELYSAPSHSRVEPWPVLRLPLPGGKAMWICPCPARTKCHHVEESEEEREKRCGTK